MAKSPKRPSTTKPAVSKKPAMRSKATTGKTIKRELVDGDERFVVFGTVTYSDTTPAVGLPVIAFDKDESREDRLGQATTDASGAYKIPYRAAAFRRSPKERGGADVIVRVYNDQNELLFTSKKKNSAPAEYQLNIQLPTQQYVVQGTVRDASGKPLHNIVVRAYDQDLRRRQKLGEGSSDREGRYRIAYSQSAFCKAEKDGADLVAVVFDAADVELSRSSVLFNAPSSATVDLTIPAEVLRPSPLFDKIGLVLEPLLDGLRVEELEEDNEHQDLSFLVGETGFEKPNLARFVLAHRLAPQGIRAEFWFVLLGSPFYQFVENQSLKEQFAAVLDALPSIDAAAVRKALTRGFSQQEISEEFRDNVAGWIEAFLKLVARRSVSGSGEPTFVKAALEHANITGAEKQEVFARLFNEHKVLTPELLDALGKDRSFKKTEIDDLQASFRLAELTRGDFSVVKMLKDEFDVRQPEKIRTLAKMSEQEWVNLVKEKHACGVIKLPTERGEAAGPIQSPAAELYGKRLERQFREAFPTTAFSGGLERAMENGGAKGLKRPVDVHCLMDRYPEFELLNTPVDEFLNQNNDPDFRALAEDEDFRFEVKAVQRVFKLAPTFEATDAMRADGIHSAQMVYRMGESEFVRSYADRPGFTVETARMAWRRAAETHAAVLTVVADLKALEANASFLPFQNQGAPVTNFPNWNNLFQTGDSCECEHCRSVLSPAAYFADLLMFLKDRKSRVGNYSAKDILLRRRPDLGYLDLNCDNALTLLPYIDLVCEVLEDVVAAGENDLEMVGFTNLSPALAALATTQAGVKTFLSLSSTLEITLSQVNPADLDRWVLRGGDVTFLLKKKGTPNFFIELLRNTTASAAELRAYPQYVNPKAYDKLRRAVHPFTLPFDLYAAEVRAGFQKASIQRWDLMRTLKAPNTPTEGDVAAEYFGISTSADPADPSEKKLILVADPNGQAALWGEAAIPGTLTNLKTFLHKTSLEYNELFALLDLKFINPRREMAVVAGTSCDIGTQSITGLDDPATAGPALDRIHRFLRLWRKLKGWKMWELDLVLRQQGIGSKSLGGEWLLDEPFLVNLFYLSEVRKRLGGKATVEQVCALFGDLNTETRFTKLHEKREDALYQRLFLNRQIIHPLDPAFTVAVVALQPPTVQKISNHLPAVLAALGIRESDLAILRGLTRPSTGAPCITDDLTLANLSFLWRNAWLGRLLKFKADDWKTLLKVSVRDLLPFPSPKSAFEFLEEVEHVKATGFTLDEVNWVLAADPSAKAASREADATRFFATLRKELDGIRAKYATAQYDFLTNSTNEEQLAGLLAALLQELNRDDATVATLLRTLRGSVSLEASVVLDGFAFPPAIAAVDRIPIRYDASGVLRFAGLMTEAQRTALLDHTSTALTALRATVRLEAGVQGGLAGFTFPGAITGAIAIQYDNGTSALRLTGLLTDAQRATLLTHASLPATVRGNPAYQGAVGQLYQDSLNAEADYRNAIEELYRQSLRAGIDYRSMEKNVVLPGGFAFPGTITGAPGGIAIRYEPVGQVLRFTGVMTAAQYTALTDPTLVALAGAAASSYRDAIDEFLNRPLLDVKFFAPVFTAPLSRQPAEADFKAHLPDQLAARITYDPEQRLLRFAGIMSPADKGRILALSGDAGYVAAVNSLAAEPHQPPAATDGRIWLTGDDLDITRPGNETYGRRLSNAARKLLAYLSRTGAENAVVGQSSAQLGLTEAVTRRLLTSYAAVPILPVPTPPAPAKATLMAYLSGNFTVDRATIDAWFWANRVAAIVKRWKISLSELDRLSSLTAGAQLLDFLALPLDRTGRIAPLAAFLKTGRLLKLRDVLPAGGITLLEVLEKLNGGVYAGTVTAKAAGLPAAFTAFPAAITTGPNAIPIQYAAGVFQFTGQMTLAQRLRLLNDPFLSAVTGVVGYRQAIEELFRGTFAGDVERMNEAWLAADVVDLVESLDLAYPADYLLAESWERLRAAFAFFNNLNAGAGTVRQFAAPAMNESHAKTLKELLRARFGAETWLVFSAAIQDVLRERKRDALAAYLLTRPRPADAPTGKWGNTNDLYAYYLLDIEMGSCQLTSRLVQASGSVQLFVQRCFMGLEPAVRAQAEGSDGDSAWRWWKWMRKYQVWVANRKVFLWPENWIEPELKKDRSPFFKDLENELVQNEINQYTAESAFANYLEKLDGVAQLEIAGFYQEDNEDGSIVHVFGRTPGAEPHAYYYRRYDYRQWTPWEKVELDIQGDYLIPAVVNQRLFLFWPVFTEIPDDAGNGLVKVPAPGQKLFAPDKTKRRLKLQMALSDYRQGKWTPKKVSKTYDESLPYTIESFRKSYRFLPIDRSGVDGRFVIQYDSHGVDTAAIEAALKAAQAVAGENKSAADADVSAATRANTAAITASSSAAGAFAQVVVYVTQAENFVPYIDDIFRTAAAKAIEARNVRTGATNIRNLAPQFGNDAAFMGDADTFYNAASETVLESERANNSNNSQQVRDAAAARAKNLARTARDRAQDVLSTAKSVRDALADDVRSTARDLRAANARQASAAAAVTALAPPNDVAFRNAAAADARNAALSGAFEISGCTGAPEMTASLGTFKPTAFPRESSVGSDTAFLKWVELPSHDVTPNDFGLMTRVSANYIREDVVLRKTPDIFRMSPAWHFSAMDKACLVANSGYNQVGTFLPFFYNDKKRTFFVLPSLLITNQGYSTYPELEQYLSGFNILDPVSNRQFYQLSQRLRFTNFYHPFVCDLANLVYNPLQGIPALMSRETQLMKDQTFIFADDYLPSTSVLGPSQGSQFSYPTEELDFSPDGAYAPYNWELFFHVPLLVANLLSKNQRFEEAREWYHFIFNPIGVASPSTGGSPMSKYWITKPFFATTGPNYIQQRIENIMRMLSTGKSGPGQVLTELERQVIDWRTNPFEPHRIANYRTVAYQKTVVMKYVDNLVAWGDNLFRQDSLESINEATQLYVLAAEILGPRPQVVPPHEQPPVGSFSELEHAFDKFSNALVQVENIIPRLPGVRIGGADRAPLPMLYFCIPQNEKMLGYWDTVADRLYKIRHCMNIEGVVRQLALFEPPIDPAALVKAIAGGVDVSAALSDLNAPLPLYRFNVLLQKANEICNDVKVLGGALFAALEKKDAESMGLLRQGQEIRLLEAVKAVREKQIEEVRENLAGLRKSRELAVIKQSYYESREFMNVGEIVAMSLNTAATILDIPVAVGYIAGGVLKAIPNFMIGASGFGGTPKATGETGGGAFGDAAKFAAEGLAHIARHLEKQAALSGTVASYDRRQDEWDFQKDLAVKETEQIDKSISSAELRISIAEKELENHVLQIENAKATDAFMRSKYTNQELYQWQVGQISGVFFQSYKLAYDLAKRAERCFRFELGLQDSSYINFGYWDSLKKGLLSGEKLQYDLRRLETAYLEQNRREFELTKHVSLALLDPLSLVKLRETGRCFFRLPEEIFDLDYPGHYFRRIKSVSVTLPCVAGPYTTVSCTLRLLKNYIRINTTLINRYTHAEDERGVWTEDPRFVESNIPVKAIAASNAQNDSGVFELSFRDERYVPFEGAGAVSEWALELFSDLPANNPDPTQPDFGRPLRQFDYGTITDAVLHIKYTAREDAGPFKNEAIGHLRKYFEKDGAVPSLRLFNLRQEFPTQWHRFLHPTSAADGNVLELEMAPRLFSIRDQGKTLKVNTIWFLARCADSRSYDVVMTPPLPAPPPSGSNKISLPKLSNYGGLHVGQINVATLGIEVVPAVQPIKWQLKMTRPGGENLQIGEVEDVILILGYEWQ